MVQSRPPLASGFHKNDWFISSKRNWANQGFKREESLNPNDPIEATKSEWLSQNDRNYPPQTPTKASNGKNFWTQTIQTRPPKAGGFYENDRDYPLKNLSQPRLQTRRIFGPQVIQTRPPSEWPCKTTETNSKTTLKLHQVNRGTQKCPTKTGSWKKMF